MVDDDQRVSVAACDTKTLAVLGEALPLIRGAAQLRCNVWRVKDRVRVMVVVVRTAGFDETYQMRVGVTLWRGILLPALQHYARFNDVPFALTVLEKHPNGLPAHRGD